MGTKGLLLAVIGLIVAVSSRTSPAQNCQGRSFTSSAEFSAGQHQDGDLVEWFNVTDTGNQLQVATPSQGMFPYANLACSARGTVARIYVGSGVYQNGQETPPPQVVGEYWTFPSSDHPTDNETHGNPSRTTVDHLGNTWVANRGEQTNGKGSVTRIALVIGGTRCDSSGNDDPDGEFLKGPFDYLSVPLSQLNRHGATVDDPPEDPPLLKTSRGLDDILDWLNTGGAQAIRRRRPIACLWEHAAPSAHGQAPGAAEPRSLARATPPNLSRTRAWGSAHPSGQPSGKSS
jgi:hypothetical protein